MQAAVAPADLPPADVAPGPTTVDWDGAALAHNRRVVVHLLARGLSLDDAEDVAQRTWTRLIALDRAGRLARVELPGLAFAQARFLAATLRREQHGQREVGGDALELVVDDRADAERTVLAKDRVARALAELERVPSSALHVFRRLLDDPPPTHAAIAKQVGLSEQRVRQIVCETRARLRRALEESR
ncbi:MAG: sigma-70 family RNA polymerase sigma factor [Deltaproteobacteria bacterium]|nr:sigma-70 family RNA polymerase sigma factor [Deltaproteobacteria bacterium]